MRSPLEIAIDITKGDERAKSELEKMYGKEFKDITISERQLGVAMLSAFKELWNK